MARYFLDTGVVVGLTFLHDAWRDEAERLFETTNSLFLSRPVIYEYTNSTRNNSLESADVDWETEKGLFGRKLARVRAGQLNIDKRIDTMNETDLDIDTLVEIFLEETRETEKTTEDLIEDYIEPRLRKFVIDEVDGRPVSADVAHEVLDTLCDTIEAHARNKRDQIRKRVKQLNVKESDRQPFVDQVGFVDGRIDQIILGSVGYLNEQQFLEKIVSSDASHLYNNRERIDASVGVKVVFIKDEFAKPTRLSGNQTD